MPTLNCMNLRNHRSNRVRRALGWVLMLAIAALPLRATTVTPPEFTQLVRESDYVVRAVVKSIRAELTAKPGKRAMVHSLVELEVKEIITGTPPTPLVLKVLGGKLGDQEMYISGAPRFVVGEESIFFVQGNGTQIYPLARMMHGHYPVLKDAASGREYVARSNGEPLASTGEVSQPMHGRETRTAARQVAAEQAALSPADFAAQIRTAAKENSAREK